MNEPVAWMDEDENVVFEKCKVYPIPLYTHPVKELTDEEIKELAIEYLENTGKGIVGVYDFVRAILQKANNGKI